MAVPECIMLARHEESHGNANHLVYSQIPDHIIALTKKGHRKSEEDGRKIKKIIKDEPLEVYLSPYLRVEQTFAGMRKSIKGNRIRLRRDPRLVEQAWGMLAHPDSRKLWREEHKKYSPFFYRIIQGEAGADVYLRVGDMMDSLWRDFQKVDYARNVLIVSHSLTIRLFIMRWFHLPYQAFDRMTGLDNGQIIVLRRKPGEQFFKIEGLPIIGLTKKDFTTTKWETA